MTSREQVEVAAKLLEWSEEHLSDRNRWSRNPLGKVIKQIVEEAGNWRNAPRGNPAKGFRVMKEKQNEQT